MLYYKNILKKLRVVAVDPGRKLTAPYREEFEWEILKFCKDFEHVTLFLFPDDGTKVTGFRTIFRALETHMAHVDVSI